MALTPETTETTVEPEPVVERIVHDPVKPAPGADAKSPEPAATEETANAAEGTAAETTEQQEAHKQSKFQRRLDRQKSARVAAETEARLLREERDRLQARLEGQSRQTQETGTTGEPQRDQFEDYEAYLRAVTRWEAGAEADKRLKAENEARLRRQNEELARNSHKKLADSWIERETAFKAATKDYEEQVNDYLDEGGEKLSSDARELIIESEVGPQLLHHLAVNPEEAERIAELSPRRQLIELGKLEDKLPKAVTRKTTNAPPPASTVRQGANSADGLRENMSQAEVRAYMKKHGSVWVK